MSNPYALTPEAWLLQQQWNAALGRPVCDFPSAASMGPRLDIGTQMHVGSPGHVHGGNHGAPSNLQFGCNPGNLQLGGAPGNMQQFGGNHGALQFWLSWSSAMWRHSW